MKWFFRLLKLMGRILFTYKKGVPASTEYGYLYNWWAAIGDKDGDNTPETSIANTGWHLPSKVEFQTLLTETGAINSSGEVWDNGGVYLKSSGFDYWNDSGDPSEYGQDTYGMGIRGYGERRTSFQNLKISTRPWVSTSFNASNAWELQFFFNQHYAQFGVTSKYYGQTIRILKDDDTWSEGDVYVGNNGVIYPTIKIGNQVWVARALEETKYRDGTDITYVDNDAAGQIIWNATATTPYGAYCEYPIP